MPSALCHVPLAIPEQFLQGGRVHCPLIRECSCHGGVLGTSQCFGGWFVSSVHTVLYDSLGLCCHL